MSDYKTSLERWKDDLRAIGYKGRGATVRRDTNEAVSVINFEQSRNSTHMEGLRFRINLGVWSAPVASYLDEPKPPVVQFEDCHYQMDLPTLLDTGEPEDWWHVTDDDRDGLTDADLALWTVGVPLLDRLQTPQGLLSYWSGELHDPGITKGVFTECDFLTYTAVLADYLEDREILSAVVQVFFELPPRDRQRRLCEPRLMPLAEKWNVLD